MPAAHTHRPANHITYTRTDPIENRRRQARDRQIKIGSSIVRPLRRRAEDVNLASAGGLEFGGGALNQNVCLGVKKATDTSSHSGNAKLQTLLAGGIFIARAD